MLPALYRNNQQNAMSTVNLDSKLNHRGQLLCIILADLPGRVYLFVHPYVVINSIHILHNPYVLPLIPPTARPEKIRR